MMGPGASPRPGGVNRQDATSSKPTRTVYSYVRVSTTDQADEGGGLDAQRAVLHAAAVARGWTIDEEIVDGGYSGSSLRRPGMTALLDQICSGDVVMASKIDRLSRSVADFAGLLARAGRDGWDLVVCELGVDTTTSQGRFVAHLMAAVAELERALISERTKAGMAAKKAAGTLRGPVGRPPQIPLQVRETIRGLREQGLSPAKIAAALNESQTPTAQGGRWWDSTIRKVLAAG